MMVLLFVLIVLGLYGAMHLYLWRSLCAAFPSLAAGGRHRQVVTALFVVMLFLPFYLRAMESGGYARTVRVLGPPGYIWMGLVFWFASFGLVMDLWNGLVRLASRMRPGAGLGRIPPRAKVKALAVLLAAATVWGLIETSSPQVRKVHVRVPGMPRGARPLRLVQISDAHVDLLHGKRRVARLVAAVRDLQPDAVVSTGDLVDSACTNIHALSRALADLKPPLGKYAVMGNHDFYAGAEGALAFHEKAGFIMLREERVPLGEHVRLAGVDDPAGLHTGDAAFTDESKALGPPRGDAVTVLLKHLPLVSERVRGRFDLQLSGHTHGGQIFPFHLVIWMIYRNGPGLHRIEDGRWLLSTRGFGTWGPPMRFLAPPEVTLITFEPVGSPAPRARGDGPKTSRRAKNL